jgi:cell division protease FtsH
MKGRLQILRVHAAGQADGARRRPGDVARRTPGFTGADLANVLNEAALLTARTNERAITQALDEAIDRVIAGPQKRTRMMNEQANAHHRLPRGRSRPGGRGDAQPTPCTKVTILPRGRALGYTMVMPTTTSTPDPQRDPRPARLHAGRPGRRGMVFHDPTTGAANDIEKATKVARKPWSPSTA